MSIVLTRRPFTATPRRRPSGRLLTAADIPQSTKARPDPPPAVPLVIEASCRLPNSGSSIRPTRAMSNLIDVCCVAENSLSASLQTCAIGVVADAAHLQRCLGVSERIPDGSTWSLRPDVVGGANRATLDVGFWDIAWMSAHHNSRR